MPDYAKKNDHAFTFGLISLIIGFVSPYLGIISDWFRNNYIVGIVAFVFGTMLIWFSRKQIKIKLRTTLLPLVIWILSGFVLYVCL